ncbi:glycosyltransferase family 2 protein [Sphingobacterium sp. SGG-5]|uniref:glycosyltransferase family 2 protein n=1 Tax=Sphingobacterium sp. SGG-5 TaxID=2710881 RepID=UPI00293BBD02|nr:glycosyltransferase [Sphingobacterium sp. SGG-5]
MILSLQISLFLLTLVYILLVLYMRKGWKILRQPDALPPPTVRVAVIIAARNEEENIGRTIECLLRQDFPEALREIIIVDDHSDDRTSTVVRSYADRGIQLIQLNESDKLNSYKKKAIVTAIQSCTADIIVTTDADCRMGPAWLQTVVGYFEQQDLYMLSSPVVYSEEKSFFERLQTLEFLYLIGLGAAGIGHSNPTTCNGANLAYRKDVFLRLGGFNGIDDLASGDDELFLHKVAEQYPDKIGFCKSRDAIVYTDAKATVKAFISQRKRWASKSTRYKRKEVVVLGILIWLYNATLLGVFFGGVFISLWYLKVFVISLAAKLLVEFLFIKPLADFATRRALLSYLPLLTFLHILYLVYIGLLGNMGKYDWKGRRVK